MDEKREREGEREFLPYQLSSPGLPNYPEGHWSRDWMNAAASTGLVPARCGWVKEGKEVKGPAEEKRREKMKIINKKKRGRA